MFNALFGRRFAQYKKIRIMTENIAITAPLTPAMVTSSITGITGLHTILDIIKISLTKAQTKGMYKVGPIRTAEISTIYIKLMKAHPETITSLFTIASFDALTQEGIDSNMLEAMFLALAAIVGGHGDIVQSDRMYMALQCMDNARFIGKTVPVVQSIVEEVSAEFFMKGAASKKDPTAYSIAPAATIIISGVATSKYFTNSGSTILSVLKVGGLVTETITVFPGSGCLVPTNWTKIVVTNVSALSAGSFSVYIQS